ncbi:DNA polymerase IV [Bacillus marinisedimentorum]|uniref:DNA polymerase IV n=1 Tax=Bacillus marinisedimentorum TaxID=1821260 RepID=UPI000871E6B4|nr:DNA polymerase IV [Bacillus marinisedimentorum]
MNEMYPKKGRVILHVDMNSFYASVEMAHDPSLKGKPLAIAGNAEERKGIIVTSSYEARAKGVKTTMPLWEAKKLCPQLIVKRPNFNRYREASLRMFEILAKYAALVQPVSIDEGYLDISGSSHLGSPLEIANHIQAEIKETLDLPCSIGIAPNKFLAKMASDMKKPMGITVLRKRDVPEVLWPLKVEEMYGIGSRTAVKLNGIGIRLIGDLAKADEYQLKQLLGINGERLKSRANGIDHSAVDPDAVAEFKSIGNSTTLPEDTTNPTVIYKTIRELSTSVARRMARKQVVSSNIQVMIRYHDRKTVTRSRKLDTTVMKEEEIAEQAIRLFDEHWNEKPIRLLGVTAQDLSEKAEAYKQLDLFSYEKEAKDEPLYSAMSKLQDKYGKPVVRRGLDPSAARKPAEEENPHKGTSFNKDFLRDQRFGSKREE